jgi:hypothetical protein
MTAFASGKYALGLCDRCGFRYELNSLKEEISNGKPTGMRVCSDCLDQDHPQNFVRLLKITDKEALDNSRIDPSLAASRALWNWNPVGHETMEIEIELGLVTVTIT